MSGVVRVGIAGAGSIALGSAALLADLSHDPMVWSPSSAGTEDLHHGVTAEGALELRFTPRIAATAEDLVRENDVVMIALPAYGHKSVMDAIAPHVRDGQHVIVSSHASMGALYLMRLLEARGV